MKILIPPDEYFAGALMRAALHFFDLTIFQVNVIVLLFAALAGYGVVFLMLSRLGSDRAYLHAAAIVTAALTIYWLWLDNAIHSSGRYYLRTALVIVTPALGALATLGALHGDSRLASPLRELDRFVITAGRQWARPLAAAFMLLTLVHVVETSKFVVAWSHYRSAVATLVAGDASDPALGNPDFVSSERIGSGLNRLSWFSTTPYLSVIVTNFQPNRLVIDPHGNYFWLSCATATANAEASRAHPGKGPRPPAHLLMPASLGRQLALRAIQD